MHSFLLLTHSQFLSHFELMTSSLWRPVSPRTGLSGLLIWSCENSKPTEIKVLSIIQQGAHIDRTIKGWIRWRFFPLFYDKYEVGAGSACTMIQHRVCTQAWLPWLFMLILKNSSCGLRQNFLFHYWVKILGQCVFKLICRNVCFWGPS